MTQQLHSPWAFLEKQQAVPPWAFRLWRSLLWHSPGIQGRSRAAVHPRSPVSDTWYKHLGGWRSSSLLVEPPFLSSLDIIVPGRDWIANNMKRKSGIAFQKQQAFLTWLVEVYLTIFWPELRGSWCRGVDFETHQQSPTASQQQSTDFWVGLIIGTPWYHCLIIVILLKLQNLGGGIPPFSDTPWQKLQRKIKQMQQTCVQKVLPALVFVKQVVHLCQIAGIAKGIDSHQSSSIFTLVAEWR